MSKPKKHAFDFEYAKKIFLKYVQDKKFKLPHNLAIEPAIAHKNNLVFFVTRDKNCYGYLRIKHDPFTGDPSEDAVMMQFLPRMKDHKSSFKDGYSKRGYSSYINYTQPKSVASLLIRDNLQNSLQNHLTYWFKG